MFNIDEWRRTFSEFVPLSKTPYPTSLQAEIDAVTDAADSTLKDAKACNLQGLLDEVVSYVSEVGRMSDLALSFRTAKSPKVEPMFADKYVDAVKRFNEQLIEEIVRLLKEECGCRSK